MKIKNTKITALISVYAKDNIAYLKEAFESVVSQTLKPAEIIFIADGPVPSDMEAYLKSLPAVYPEVKNVFLPQNMGRGLALNKAFECYTYDLIAIVDSDDINLPQRFEKLASAFEQDSSLAVVGAQIQEIDFTTKQPVAVKKVPLSNADIYKYIKYRSPFNQMTVMLKKPSVTSAGGYQPMHLMEDYYLWIRMAAQGFKMLNLPDILVHARVDKKMYARRGGFKYFKSNKAVQDVLLKHKIIGYPAYLFNLTVRFTVQVLMPNTVRSLFYKKVLR